MKKKLNEIRRRWENIAIEAGTGNDHLAHMLAQSHAASDVTALLAMIDALLVVVEAADSGEWHTSRDCRVEKRDKDCGICQALTALKKVKP